MKRKIAFLCSVAMLSGMSCFPVSAETASTTATPATVTTSTTAVINEPIAPQNGYYQFDGYFDEIRNMPHDFYVGEPIDMSDWILTVCYLLNGEKAFLNLQAGDGISVTSEEYAHCFTIDTSEVDTSKEGYYNIYIHTNPGEKAKFVDAWNNTHELTMQDYTIRKRIAVTPRPDPQIFVNAYADNILDNDSTIATIVGNATADMTGLKITAEPEGLVEIGDIAIDYTLPKYYKIPIKALQSGVVTLTATNDQGLTATKEILIRDSSMYFEHFINSEYVGQICDIAFHCESDQPAEFSIADENVARIVNTYATDFATVVRVEILSEDSTTLKAVTSDGKSTECTIIGYTTETTAIWSEITSKETTTTEQPDIGYTTETIAVIPPDCAEQTVTDATHETQNTTTITTETLKENTALGDVNQDNKINIMDIILVNKAIYGKATLSNTQELAADCDKNQKVDSTDSLLIMKYILKLIDQF